MNKCICGYELSADDAFCPQCGEKVKSGNEIALPKSEAVDSKSGESLTEAERDARVLAGQVVATCKHVLMPEDEFCPECGAKVRR